MDRRTAGIGEVEVFLFQKLEFKTLYYNYLVTSIEQSNDTENYRSHSVGCAMNRKGQHIVFYTK